MPYITTADLSQLGYKWDATVEPELLNMCITASSMVDAYVQRVLPGGLSFDPNDVSEVSKVRVSNGLFKYFPKYYKINSVDSITLSADAFINLEVSADNFKIIQSDGVILGRAIIANGEYYVVANYNIGFKPIVTTVDVTNPVTSEVTTVTTTTSTLPIEIKKATVLVAQNLLSEYFMVKNFNVSMLTMFKQGSLQFQRSSKLLKDAIPSSAQLLLAEYRRVR